MRKALQFGVLGALLAIPGLTNASAPPRSQQLATIESATRQIRGLSQLRPVRAVFPSDAGFTRALRAEMTVDSPAASVALGQKEDVLVGFIGPHDSMHQILFSGIGAQVAGFYDYHHRILYVRQGASAFGPAWRWAIAHEYTHALQDEHYGLGRLMPDETNVPYRNSDAEAAHHDLTEGDAVTTQDLFIQKTYTAADMRALINAQQHLPKTPPVPKAIERDFNFPYTTGLAFVQYLYARGGMAAIDAAYRRLPSSTYEIMHPAAYLKGWRPVPVALHHVQGFAGWRQPDDDVFGAADYNLLIWQGLGVGIANKVTNAYRGDRYVFLEKGRQEAMLFKSVWTTAKTAAYAERELIDALRVRYHGNVMVKGGAGETVLDTDGAVYFVRSGARLTMAYAGSAAIARHLGAAATT